MFDTTTEMFDTTTEIYPDNTTTGTASDLTQKPFCVTRSDGINIRVLTASESGGVVFCSQRLGGQGGFNGFCAVIATAVRMMTIPPRKIIKMEYNPYTDAITIVITHEFSISTRGGCLNMFNLTYKMEDIVDDPKGIAADALRFIGKYCSTGSPDQETTEDNQDPSEHTPSQ